MPAARREQHVHHRGPADGGQHEREHLGEHQQVAEVADLGRGRGAVHLQARRQLAEQEVGPARRGEQVGVDGRLRTGRERPQLAGYDDAALAERVVGVAAVHDDPGDP